MSSSAVVAMWVVLVLRTDLMLLRAAPAPRARAAPAAPPAAPRAPPVSAPSVVVVRSPVRVWGPGLVA
ncbi:hypothetical protein C5D35_00980 [Rathayibacter toxicus]|nr:hypothetical protein C5D35_00980 [Rathayibacter toxicus]